MKKVIHCLNHYLPHPIGGTEIYAVSLIKHLTNLGIQGKVLLPNYNSTVNAAYLADGIEVLKFAEPSIVDRELILGLRKPSGIKGFLEILKKENPAIVHFHELAGSNGITLHHVKAAKAAGFKVVFTFHLTGYTCKTGNLMYKEKVICDGVIDISKCSACYLESKNMGTMTTGIVNQLSGLAYLLQYNTVKWKSKLGTALATPFLVASVKQILLELIDNCDQVISITQWYKNILIINQVDSDKIRFIAQGLPNPVEESSATAPNDGVLKLVFVGRISAFKGIMLLIQAMKNIPADKLSLDIYGSHSEDEYYNDCRKESSEMKNIHWKGSIESKAVVPLLRHYDVFCLASTFSEMSPLVIQEAFAAGIPVLASNVYGNAEQITEGVNGWLFQFKNVHELKGKIEMLINNPSLISAAKSNLPEPRTFDQVAKEYFDLYNQVID